MAKLYRSLSRPAARDRFQFRFYFHAKQIPNLVDKLLVSIVPFGTQKAVAKTTKVHSHYGTCRWPDPVTESTRITQNPFSKKYEEKLYKLVLSKGSLQSSFLGEASINLTDFINTKNSSNLALPLKNCCVGIVLYVKIQCINPRTRMKDRRKLKASHFTPKEGAGIADFSKNSTTEILQPLAAQADIKTSDEVKDASSLGYTTDSSESMSHISHGCKGQFDSFAGDVPLIDHLAPSFPCWQDSIGENTLQRTVVDQQHSDCVCTDVEAVKAMVQKLQAESRTSYASAQKLKSKVETLKQKLFSQRIETDHEMAKSILKGECDSLKMKLENLIATANLELESKDDNVRWLTEDTKGTIKELQEEIPQEKKAIFSLQLSKIQDSNMELVSTVADLEDTLELQDREIQSLKEENKKLKAFMETSQFSNPCGIQKLIAKDEILESYVKEISKLDLVHSSTMLQNNGGRPIELNRKTEMVKRDIVQLDKERWELSNKNALLVGGLEKVNGELEENLESFMDIGKRFEMLMTNLQSNKLTFTVQIEKSDYSDKLEAEQEENMVMKGTVRALTEQLAMLSTMLNLQLAANKNLELRSSEVEIKNEKLDIILADLQKENLQLSKRTSNLQAELRHLTEEAEFMKLKEEDLQAYIFNIQAEKARMEAASKTLTAEQKQKIFQLEQKLEDVLGQTINQNQVKQTLEMEIEQLRHEILKLKHSNMELEALVISQKSLRSVLEQQFQEALQDCSSFAATVTSLEEEIVRLQGNADQREKELKVEKESYLNLNEQGFTEERLHDAYKIMEKMNVMENADGLKLQKLESQARIYEKKVTFEETSSMQNKKAELIRMEEDLDDMRDGLNEVTIIKKQHQRRAETAEEIVECQESEDSSAEYCLQNKLLHFAEQFSSIVDEKECFASEALLNFSEFRVNSKSENPHWQMQDKCKQADAMHGDKMIITLPEVDNLDLPQKDTERNPDEVYEKLEQMTERKMIDGLYEKERIFDGNISIMAVQLNKIRAELEVLEGGLVEMYLLKKEHEDGEIDSKTSIVYSLYDKLQQLIQQLFVTLDEEEKVVSLLLEPSKLYTEYLVPEDCHKQMLNKHVQNEEATSCFEEKFASDIEGLTAELAMSKKQRKDMEHRLQDAYKKLERMEVIELNDRLKIQELKGRLTEALQDKERYYAENIILRKQAEELVRSKMELENIETGGSMALNEEEARRWVGEAEIVRRIEPEKANVENSLKIKVLQLAQQLPPSIDKKEKVDPLVLDETFEIQSEKFLVGNDSFGMYPYYFNADPATASLKDKVEAKMEGVPAEFETSKSQKKATEEELYDAYKNLEKFEVENLENIHSMIKHLKQEISEKKIFSNNHAAKLTRSRTELVRTRSRLKKVLEDHQRQDESIENIFQMTQSENANANASSRNKLHDLPTLVKRERVVSESLLVDAEAQPEKLNLDETLRKDPGKCRQAENAAFPVVDKLATEIRDLEFHFLDSKKYEKNLLDCDAYKDLKLTETDDLKTQKLAMMMADINHEKEKISEENLLLKKRITKLMMIKAELEDVLSCLEQDHIKSNEELEMCKKYFAEREHELCNKIRLLEMSNEKVTDSCVDQLQAELLRLQKQIASFSKREHELLSNLSLMEIIQTEVQQLQEEKEELESYLSRLLENVDHPNMLEKIVSLEMELAEAREARDTYKLQIDRVLQNLEKPPLQIIQNMNQVEFDAVRNQVAKLEADLKELRYRYAITSLRLAEVEAEKGELLLIIKNLRRKVNSC